MIRFDLLKMVLYDFDDTLCIHTNHTSNEDQVHRHEVDVLVHGKDTWNGGSINNHMKEFMKLCTKFGLRQGLISATTPHHSAPKCEWVEANYGIKLENFCVSRAEDKSRTMWAIKDAYNYRRDQVMIVDDYWKVLEMAANAGFQAYSPMQIVNYIASLRKGNM